MFLVLTPFGLSGQDQKSNLTDEEAAKMPYRVSLAGFADSGTFYLYVKESLLGQAEFSRQKSGEVTNTFTVALGGQTAEAITKIAPDASGAWQAIETVSPQGKVIVERQGFLVTRNILGQRSTVQLKADSLLYDDNIPALLSDIVLKCDLTTKGKQPVSLFISPAAAFDVSVEFLGEVERPIAGNDVRFRKYMLYLPGVDTSIWTDGSGRVVLYDIPMQKAYFVRQGYETLAKKTIDDPLLSKPQYNVSIKKNVMVPMRDKVQLATDIYLPEIEAKIPLAQLRQKSEKRK